MSPSHSGGSRSANHAFDDFTHERPKEAAKILETQSEKILTHLQGVGTESEVLAIESEEMKVVFENKDYSVSAAHKAHVFGARTVRDHRLGFSTTNSLLESDLKHVAQEAITIAKLSPPSEHHVLPRAVSGTSKLHHECYDAKFIALAPGDVLRYADLMIAECFADPRITVDRAELSITQHVSVVTNSHGVKKKAASTAASWFVMGMAKIGNEVTSFDYEGTAVSHLDHMESEIRRTVGLFRDSVLGSLGARPGKSYSGKILLHPHAVADLLLGLVTVNCNGMRHQDGMSMWKDRVGEVVAHPSVHITQNPNDVNRPQGWMPFDREGVDTVRRDLIHDGKLRMVAHNAFSAHRGGVDLTGNASGGARSLPAIGFSNLTWEIPRNAFSEEALMKELGTGLVVKRFAGNEDPASGHFSGIAKNSWWVENGQRTHAVQEMMIAGNLFEALKHIVACGNVLHDYGHRMPYVLIDGVSVTAG